MTFFQVEPEEPTRAPLCRVKSRPIQRESDRFNALPSIRHHNLPRPSLQVDAPHEAILGIHDVEVATG